MKPGKSRRHRCYLLRLMRDAAHEKHVPPFFFQIWSLPSSFYRELQSYDSFRCNCRLFFFYHSSCAPMTQSLQYLAVVNWMKWTSRRWMAQLLRRQIESRLGATLSSLTFFPILPLFKKVNMYTLLQVFLFSFSQMCSFPDVCALLNAFGRCFAIYGDVGYEFRISFSSIQLNIFIQKTRIEFFFHNMHIKRQCSSYMILSFNQ